MKKGILAMLLCLIGCFLTACSTGQSQEQVSSQLEEKSLIAVKNGEFQISAEDFAERLSADLLGEPEEKEELVYYYTNSHLSDDTRITFIENPSSGMVVEIDITAGEIQSTFNLIAAKLETEIGFYHQSLDGIGTGEVVFLDDITVEKGTYGKLYIRTKEYYEKVKAKQEQKELEEEERSKEIQKQLADERKEKENAKITLEEFEQLKDGISYEKAVEIIGSKGELSTESGDMKMYIWEGNGGLGSNAACTFYQEKLNAKSQIGLE